MKKNIYFIAISLFLSSTSFAGEFRVIGSGGDALLCNSPTGDQYVTLDQYEYEKLHKTSADFSNLSGSPFERARQIVKRLENHGPRLTKNLTENIFSIEKNFIPVSADLVDIEDSKHALLPKKNCSLTQAAIQTIPAENEKNHKVKYYFSNHFWNNADVNQKAVIIVHEAIYSEFIKQYTPNVQAEYLSKNIAIQNLNSTTTREFVGLLISNRINTLSTLDYLRFLLYSGFEWAGEINNFKSIPTDLSNFYFIDTEFLDHDDFFILTSNNYDAGLHASFDKNGNIVKLIVKPQEDKSNFLAPYTENYERISFIFNIYPYSSKEIRYRSQYHLPTRIEIPVLFCNDTPVENFTSTLSKDKTDPVLIASQHINQLNRFSYTQGNEYNNYLLKIKSEINWVQDVDLLQTNKSIKSSNTPYDCEYKNIISASLDSVPDSINVSDLEKTRNFKRKHYRYLIGDKTLWDKLSPIHQAFVLTNLTLLSYVPPYTWGKGESQYYNDLSKTANTWARVLFSKNFNTATDLDYLKLILDDHLPFWWASTRFTFFENHSPQDIPEVWIGDRDIINTLVEDSGSLENLLTSIGFTFDTKNGQLQSWSSIQNMKPSFYLFNPQDQSVWNSLVLKLKRSPLDHDTIIGSYGTFLRSTTNLYDPIKTPISYGCFNMTEDSISVTTKPLVIKDFQGVSCEIN